MRDRIKVSTIAHRLKSTSCSDQSRPHPSGCTLFFPFRGPDIGTHHSIPAIWRNIPPGETYNNDLHRVGLPYCDTPEASATPPPPITISGGSGTSTDPYIVSDPLSVSLHSLRSHMLTWRSDHSVYFQWEIGNRAGEWTVSIDATPNSHDFALYGRDDQGDAWDDTGRSWGSGDESITITVQSGGHIFIRVGRSDHFNHPPIGLTLTIRPPARTDLTEQTAMATPTPTSTPATSTPTPTATPTIASSPFTSGGSGTSSDPYVISDPTSVSSRSIRSYVSDLQARQSVYFRWDVGGDRFGRWSISIDASPSSHDFDLYGRDDRDDQIGEWDDYGTSNSGDEGITLYMLGQGHIILRVRNYDGGAPTDLTLSISPPTAAGSAVPIAGATATPTATPTATSTATPTATPTPTPTATPTATPSATPTATPIASASELHFRGIGNFLRSVHYQ